MQQPYIECCSIAGWLSIEFLGRPPPASLREQRHCETASSPSDLSMMNALKKMWENATAKWGACVRLRKMGVCGGPGFSGSLFLPLSK